VRKTALDEGSRRKDDIFDAYLEDPDWETAPRKKMPDNVETYLDLAATEEDHGENLVIRDVTMQAGKERSSLPLMRRFNDHSEKLLQAGKKKDATGRSTIPMVADDLYDQIEYEDLRAAAAPAPIPLEVQDANERDDADGARGILPGRNDDELLAMADIESRKIADWSADFTSVCLANPANPSYPPAADDMEAAATFSTFSFQRDAQMVAGRVVRDMHVASNAEDAVLPPLPNAILEQMRSCHNAATEFLRQYWSAILPAAPGALGAGTQAHSPQVRAARATKMARYLEGTEGKVNAIVTTAEIARVDPDRVRAAMAPTLGAVSVALRREKLRTGVKA
jgi:transcription initiation factor TFIIH subunit 1